MSLNLDKLLRLEERLADRRAAQGAKFDRYRERVQTAEELRRLAVAQAHPDVKGTAIPALLAMQEEQREAYGVDSASLASAARELAAANIIKAQFDIMGAEMQPLAALVGRLTKYAEENA